MTKERKIIVIITIISILLIAIFSYFLINKNAIIEKQAEKIELQAMETNGSNSYITTQEHLKETSQNIAKINEFKKAIADYIEEAGGIKPEYTANSITFGESIKGIVKEVTKDATATAEDIVEGKTAYVNGEMLTGTKIDDTNITFTTIYTGRLGVQDGTAKHTINANIKPLIEDYQNLTAKNFLFQISSITGNATGDNCNANISKSYNASTGTIKVSVTYGGSGNHAFIYGSLICVH